MQNTLDRVTNARRNLTACPPTHPLHWSNQKELVFALWGSYEATGSLLSIMECVQVLEEYYAHACVVSLPTLERIFICDHLCVALHRLSRQTKSREHLRRSIEITQECLSLRTSEHLDRDLTINKLAFMHVDMFNLVGEIEHLMVAISLLEEKLIMYSKHHPERHEVCMNLATFYMKTMQPGFLGTAMRYAREAVDLCNPADSRRQAAYHITLAQLESSANDFLSAEPAVVSDVKAEVAKELLALWPLDHPKRASTCGGLAAMLFLLYTKDGDVGKLNEAAEVCRRGLEDIEGCTIEQQGSLCETLAVILASHYQDAQNISYLQEVVDRGRVAYMLLGDNASQILPKELVQWMIQLAVKTKDHLLLEEATDVSRAYLDQHLNDDSELREKAVDSLCLALKINYSYAGKLGALDELIRLLRKERALCAPSNIERQVHVSKLLCEALGQRWGHVPDPLLLDEIETITQQTMQVCREDDGSFVDQLAKVLMWKAMTAAHISLMDESITLFRKATAASRLGGRLSRQVECYCNLSSALFTRYKHFSCELASLKEAMAVSQQAWAILSASEEVQLSKSFYHSMVLCHLARTTYYAGLHRNDSAPLREAMNLSKNALAITTNPWQRRIIFILQANIHSTLPVDIDSDDLSNIRNATAALLRSFDAAVGDYSFDMLSDVLDCLVGIWDAQVLPNVLALLHPVYQKIHQLIPILGQYSLDNRARLQAFMQYRRLGSCAFTCGWAAGETRMALEHLEHSQGLLWSEAIQIRDGPAQSMVLPTGLGSELKALFEFSTSPTRADVTQHLLDPDPYHENAWITDSDLRHRNGTRITQILQEVRRIPGLERFLLGPTYEDLREAATDQNPLVLLVEGKQHHFAVLLRSKEHEVDIFTFKLNLKTVSGSGLFLSNLGASRTVTEVSEEGREVHRAMRPTVKKDEGFLFLENLWRVVVKPVLGRLEVPKTTPDRVRPRITWIATDAFAFLPVHAAVSSYTPTISALRRAQLSPGDQTTITRENMSLLLVSDAEGGRSHGLASIRGVEEEIECIKKIATPYIRNITCYQTGTVSIDQVRRDITGNQVIHLACHGVQDPSDPLQSGFYLDNQRLTISELMGLNLKNPFLAFLSACETAQGDLRQSHQAMHLASAMLFSGFRSVVATMWSISDDDGPFVAKLFYESILAQSCIDTNTIAFALDAAVTELRRTGADPRRWAPFVHFGA